MSKQAARVSVFFLALFVPCVGFFMPAYAQMVPAAVTTQPIVITESGSYRLDRNLNVPGNAIDIRASFVTLDLNGFNVTATGLGITTTGGQPQKVVVINGTIDAGVQGVLLNRVESRIERISVTASVGISVGANSIVKKNIVSGTNAGIICTACIVTENSVAVNTSGQAFDFGISASRGSLVLGNTVSGSAGVGMSLDDTTGYANNVLSNNQGGDVRGGVQIGNNLCATSGICQ